MKHTPTTVILTHVCVCGGRKLGRLSVCAEEKWQCVFEECWSQLGCGDPAWRDQQKALEIISVALSSSRKLQDR